MPVNNATKAAVVNQDSYAENIFNSAASDNVTPSTYNSFKTNAIANQNSSIQRLLVLLRQDNLANIANSFSTEKRNNFN